MDGQENQFSTITDEYLFYDTREESWRVNWEKVSKKTATFSGVNKMKRIDRFLGMINSALEYKRNDSPESIRH